jgi:hypothetical protein
MPAGSKFSSAVGRTGQGQSCTEGIMYFTMTALLIAAFILIFEIVIPGREFIIPGAGTFFISYDFYRVNSYYFNTFAAMIGLGISWIIIRFHKRSVEKRVLKFAKGMR